VPRTSPANPTTAHKFLLKIIAVYPVFTVRKTIVSRAAKAAIRERARAEGNYVPSGTRDND